MSLKKEQGTSKKEFNSISLKSSVRASIPMSSYSKAYVIWFIGAHFRVKGTCFNSIVLGIDFSN